MRDALLPMLALVAILLACGGGAEKEAPEPAAPPEEGEEDAITTGSGFMRPGHMFDTENNLKACPSPDTSATCKKSVYTTGRDRTVRILAKTARALHVQIVDDKETTTLYRGQVVKLAQGWCARPCVYETPDTPFRYDKDTAKPVDPDSTSIKCNDGTPANCTGRGCCSHHGGVAGGGGRKSRKKR